MFNNVRNNPFIRSFYCTVRAFFSKKSRVIKKYNHIFSNIDSISNFNSFKDTIIELKTKSLGGLTTTRYSFMSYFYGYYNELLVYGSTRKYYLPLVGDMEHGINFSCDKLEYKKHCICYTSQGNYRRNDIREIDKNMPFYSIGPYINYARDYYSEEMIREIKNRNGKTLLVFPSHSYEMDSYRFSNSSYVDFIYNHYANHYDTVYVCVYWNDVDAKDVDEFIKRGAVIVSAGFRGDNNFIRRLKTIIRLADCVVANDIGTNIGYCLALNKKVILLDDKNRVPTDSPIFENYYKLLMNAFSTIDGKFTSEQIEQQNYYYNHFWGGNLKKTAEEINAFFGLIRIIYKKSFFNVNNRKKIIQKMISGKIKISSVQKRVLEDMLV